MRKKGFTLIELLVVIAIIALLLSILLPSLNKVKQIARDVVCRTNIKQWSLVYAMYNNDNEGKFPGNIDNPPGEGDYAKGEWIAGLRSYMETDSDISLCSRAKKDNPSSAPADRMYGSTFTSHEMYNGVSTYEKSSYGVNCWTYAEKLPNLNGYDNLYWKKATAARNPSNIPVFMDSKYRGASPHYGGANGGSTPDPMNPSPEEDTQPHWSDGMSHFAMARHSSGSKAGINVMFMDLSVSHVEIKKLWRLKWYKGMNTAGYTQNGGTWPEWIQKYKD